MPKDSQSRSVECPTCGTRLKFSSEQLGKKVRCGSCEGVIQLPAPRPPAIDKETEVAGRAKAETTVDPTSPARKSRQVHTPAAPSGEAPRPRAAPAKAAPSPESAPPAKKLSGRAQRLAELFRDSSGEFPRPQLSMSLRLMSLVVLCVMLTLPVIYLAFAAGVGWLTWWHATHDMVWVRELRGRAQLAAGLTYIALIVVGVMWLLSMLKPLFRWEKYSKVKGLKRKEDPLLYMFCDKLADTVGAPHPDVICLSIDINASAAYQSKWFGLGGRQFILTLGLPLIAGLSLEQLAGVIAHEFGHFSQKGSTFLTRSVYRINHWFAQVVYSRDVLDDILAGLTSGGGGTILMLVGLVCQLVIGTGRAIMWCLMMFGHAVSSTLMRQMEYDADQYECGVVGSEVFATSTRRMVELNLAAELFLEFVTSQRKADGMPANYPEFISELADKSRTIAKGAKKHISEERGHLLATHPPMRHRIAAAERLDLPGMFASDEPAQVVLSQYQERCEALTLLLYTHVFRYTPKSRELSETARLIDPFLEAVEGRKKKVGI